MTLDDYREIYGDIEPTTFNRLSLYAKMLLEKYTTTLDGVCKIRQFPPEDDAANERIMLALGQLIDLENKIERVSSAGLDTTKSGSIASISSGDESISFHNSAETSFIAKAGSDQTVKVMLEQQIIESCLFGLKDSNGINLLYRGIYPKRYLR